MNKPKERGNVLFLILIAVALFAALSYVVVHSSRTSAGSVDQEGIKLKAAKILQYVSSVRVATQRLYVSGKHIDEIQIHKTGEQTAVCDPDPLCVFGPTGGGAIEIPLDPDYNLDYDGNVWGYRDYADNETVYKVGTISPELLIVRYFKIGASGEQMCKALNKGVGLSDPDTIPMIDGTNASLATYPAVPSSGAACSQHGTDYYVFYSTLVEN